ncbi:hypothetical protein CIB48_g6441 [Xylaria polymorpha]|nr:hypothetical protein CIB48_g6441 [Xylaria polymorpha]
MSSPTKSTLPMKPPLNATNSWVIRRARELIGYERYGAVEQWLDDVDDDGENDNYRISNHGNNHGNSPSKSPHYDHRSSRPGHPAGELEEYDPDCPLFSQKTIVEVLEAAATETEAGHDSADDAEHWDTVSSLSLASCRYGYLPSVSLEGEPLLDDYENTQEADPRSTTDGKLYLDSGDVMDSLFPFVDLDALLFPSLFNSDMTLGLGPGAGENAVLGNELDNEPTLARTHIGEDNTPSVPSSQFLTVPSPAYTARSRDNTLNQAGKYPIPIPIHHPSPSPDAQGHNYVFAQPYYPDLEIERGASPMPRFRGESPYPVSPESELPPTSSTGSSSSRLTGPQRSRRNFHVASFASRRRVGGQVPMLTTVDEDGGGDGDWVVED